MPISHFGCTLHARVVISLLQNGVLINRLQPLAPVAKVLKKFDVLMEIAGVPVSEDGTIEFKGGVFKFYALTCPLAAIAAVFD